jgi:hypothetical protein
MPSEEAVVVLDSEEAVLKAIDGLLSGQLDPEKTQFDLSHTEWAAVEFKFEGEPYKATIPTSTMKGIVEFQDALHRSAALTLRDVARKRNLSSDELSDFELVFKVEDGSSDLKAAAAELVKRLGEKFLNGMSDKQSKLCALSLIFLFVTGGGAYLYKDYALESQKAEAEARKDAEHNTTVRQISSDGLERDRLATERERTLAAERDRLISELVKQSGKVEQIVRESEGGYDAVVRNSGRADYVILQGIPLTKEDLAEIKRRTRRTAEKTVLKDEAFKIEGVDPTDPKVYVVRLRRLKTDEIIVAQLDDAVTMERFKAVIQRGEWSRSPIVATVSVRRIGDEIKEAKILKAHTPRAKRKKKR